VRERGRERRKRWKERGGIGESVLGVCVCVRERESLGVLFAPAVERVYKER
jgi:hypothetical protein